MLPSFCRDVVTVKRAQMVDKRGSIVADWSNPQTFDVSGCSVQPQDTVRDFDGRELSVSQSWVLYAPTGSDLEAGDRVEWQDTTFEISGAPMPWTSPTGRVSHIWARLEEWSG